MAKTVAVQITNELDFEDNGGKTELYIGKEGSKLKDAVKVTTNYTRKLTDQEIDQEIKKYMSDIGKKGGQAKSEKKTAAARENAKKPRPRKKGNE